METTYVVPTGEKPTGVTINVGRPMEAGWYGARPQQVIVRNSSNNIVATGAIPVGTTIPAGGSILVELTWSGANPTADLSLKVEVAEDPAFSENLRQMAVQYMRDMASVEWGPSETMTLVGLTYEKGNSYKGLPYTNDLDSTLEEFLAHLTGGEYAGPTQEETAYGVDCSSSILASWARFDPYFTCTWTKQLKPYASSPGPFGTVFVGSYTAPAGADYETDTSDIIAHNGQDTMFASYDMLKPGDAVVTFRKGSGSGTGHARMVVSADRAKREITTIEITSSFVAAGDSAWRVDKVYTYEQLYADNYIPITCQALKNYDEGGERAEAEASAAGGELDDELNLTGMLTSNHRIFAVIATVYRGTDVVAAGALYPVNTSREPGALNTIISKQVDLTKFNDKLSIERGSVDRTLIITALIAGEEHTVLTLTILPEELPQIIAANDDGEDDCEGADAAAEFTAEEE